MMSQLSHEVKKFIEHNIKLIEENDWDTFFNTAQSEYIPQTVNQIVKTLESAGIFPISYMTFIPEGYYLQNNTLDTYVTPPNIINICYKAFAYSDIKSLTITSNVMEIGDDAFCACDFLTHVTIENGCKYIGDSAFYSSSDLEYIKLPSSIISLGRHVFTDCSNLQEIHYDGTKKQWESIKNHDFINASSYIMRIICNDGVISLVGE